jgi:hypothetical protein
MPAKSLILQIRILFVLLCALAIAVGLCGWLMFNLQDLLLEERNFVDRMESEMKNLHDLLEARPLVRAEL